MLPIRSSEVSTPVNTRESDPRTAFKIRASALLRQDAGTDSDAMVPKRAVDERRGTEVYTPPAVIAVISSGLLALRVDRDSRLSMSS